MIVRLVDSGIKEDNFSDANNKSFSDEEILRMMNFLKSKMGENDGN